MSRSYEYLELKRKKNTILIKMQNINLKENDSFQKENKDIFLMHLKRIFSVHKLIISLKFMQEMM